MLERLRDRETIFVQVEKNSFKKLASMSAEEILEALGLMFDLCAASMGRP